MTVTHLSLSRCTYCVSGAKRKFSDTQHSTCATKAHLYDCSSSQCCDSVHTALILCSRLYQTVQCPSVRPSVCPRMGHSTKLCCHWPSGRRYQLTAGQHSAANASSVTLRPKVRGSTDLLVLLLLLEQKVWGQCSNTSEENSSVLSLIWMCQPVSD